MQAEEVERRDAKGAVIRWRESDKKRHEARDTGCKAQDTEYGARDAERGARDAERRARDAGCGAQGAAYVGRPTFLSAENPTAECRLRPPTPCGSSESLRYAI